MHATIHRPKLVRPCLGWKWTSYNNYSKRMIASCGLNYKSLKIQALCGLLKHNILTQWSKSIEIKSYLKRTLASHSLNQLIAWISGSTLFVEGFGVLHNHLRMITLGMLNNHHWWLCNIRHISKTAKSLEFSNNLYIKVPVWGYWA